MLDNLPAWARHLLIVFGAAFGGSVASAIIASAGVSTLDWPLVLVGALDIAAVSTATTAAALWLTPLTRQYGVGASK